MCFQSSVLLFRVDKNTPTIILKQLLQRWMNNQTLKDAALDIWGRGGGAKRYIKIKFVATNVGGKLWGAEKNCWRNYHGILRQHDARRPTLMVLLQMHSQYHTQHCTRQAFEQFWALICTNIWKWQTGIRAQYLWISIHNRAERAIMSLHESEKTISKTIKVLYPTPCPAITKRQTVYGFRSKTHRTAGKL